MSLSGVSGLGLALLDAVGVPLFQGRRFTAADQTALRTVIVNKPFADKFLQWLGRSGQDLQISARDAVPRR